MPVEWHDEMGAPDETGAPSRVRVLECWPHRSLPRRGFAAFFAITGALVAVPLLSVIGTPVFAFVLVPVVLVVGLTWAMIERSYRDADLIEELRLTRTRMRLERRDPDGRRRDWEANPYWVRVRLHPEGPVENYLTLAGGPREVELGAFLSPDERLELKDDLERALGDLRAA
jgi:uncharacterized membrane protein